MAAGRPTDYKPEYCEHVIALARAGHSRNHICFELQISRSTLNLWVTQHPEFSEAMQLADEYFKAYLEHLPVAYGFLEKFNSAAWEKLMRYHCRMSHNRLLNLPSLKAATSYQDQHTAIKNAVADGEITADEASKLTNLVTSQVTVDEATTFDQRLKNLEQK